LASTFRQHQPAALAARKLTERGLRLLAGEQEILQIADDVLGFAVDHDGVAIAAATVSAR